MPRFKSRLFNLIDRSAPVQFGRSVRQLLDQKLKQFAGLTIQELPRLLAYQVAKAALYPVYLIASAAKRTFPELDRTLDRPKLESTEILRSQPDSGGLLPESDAIAEQLDHAIESNQEIPKPDIPLLLRPLATFFNWLDRTKIRLDNNIAAIIKRSPDNLTTSATYELESKLLANRIFAEIWQQQVEQSPSTKNSLKESDGLVENVALGKNIRLEQLRNLIEAAIAYFFGNQSNSQNFSQNLNIQDESIGNGVEVAELSDPESFSHQALVDSKQSKRKKIDSANLSDRLLTDSKKSTLQKNPSQSPATKEFSGEIEENASLTQSLNLDRLRKLIAAAIAYFIEKRSLGSNTRSQVNLDVNEVQSTPSEFLSGEVSDKLQTSNENSNALKVEDQIERLQKLIEEAIAYFFGKQRSQTALDETSDMSVKQSSWLTMEDAFCDDNGPWPLPLEFESHAFAKSLDMSTINSSGELQKSETTTSQISQSRLEESLLFEDALLMHQSSSSKPESDRPLRAWLESKASIMGYAYNPAIAVIMWIDAIVLKVEDLIIIFWKGLINFPKKLIHSIRYGRK